MTSLLVAKQYLKKFYGRYEVYLIPLWKFLLAFISLILINGKLGFMEKIDKMTIVLIVALMCSFMPMNFIAFVAAGFIILHFYALSLECAAVALVLFLVMFLLYFRFSPKDTLVVVLLPICFVLKIPYVIPLAMGLLGTPASVVSTGCGVMVNYLVNYMSDNATAISAMGEEEITTKLRYIIDGLMDNREMLLTIAAFAITIIVVYIIRRLSVDHAWTIAMIGGAIVNVVVLLVGDLMFDTNVSIVGIFVGTIISLLIVKVLEFFVFHLDYNRVEKVQFEDDEYYYYVKAVPKITMAAPSKTVKRINTPRRKSGGSQSRH